jgi:hypothetical protein
MWESDVERDGIRNKAEDKHQVDVNRLVDQNMARLTDPSDRIADAVTAVPEVVASVGRVWTALSMQGAPEQKIRPGAKAMRLCSSLS